MSLPPGYNLLKQYPNEIYIETGIWRGDSIQLALEAGFKKIIGIEIDHECIEFCRRRFDLINRAGWHGIELFFGDSARQLAQVLQTVSKPATIFLDSHAQWLEGEPEYATPFPLIDELRAIARHTIKTEIIHTIIIDDILHLTHPDITGWSFKTIADAVRMVYNDYSLSLVANPVKNNILICKP
jgi:hypothetical protein